MAKKGKPFLTVYTVSLIELDGKSNTPIQSNTIGSYMARGDAIRECANYMLERMMLRQDIRKAIYLDDNHGILRYLEDEKGFNLEWTDRVLTYPYNKFDWNCDKAHQRLKQALFDYFTDELGGQSCYRVSARLEDGLRQLDFDITENDVEGTVEGIGDAWTCVTSGSSDNGDEQFEQPFPEVFLSEKEAVKCAIDDLIKGYLNDADPKHIKDILKDARNSFRRHGKYSYALNGSTVRRWDIWYTPILLSGKFPKVALTRRKKGKDRWRMTATPTTATASLMSTRLRKTASEDI